MTATAATTCSANCGGRLTASGTLARAAVVRTDDPGAYLSLLFLGRSLRRRPLHLRCLRFPLRLPHALPCKTRHPATHPPSQPASHIYVSTGSQGKTLARSLARSFTSCLCSFFAVATLASAFTQPTPPVRHAVAIQSVPQGGGYVYTPPSLYGTHCVHT